MAFHFALHELGPAESAMECLPRIHWTTILRSSGHPHPQPAGSFNPPDNRAAGFSPAAYSVATSWLRFNPHRSEAAQRFTPIHF
jgi:hypothetical protein